MQSIELYIKIKQITEAIYTLKDFMYHLKF